MIDENDILEYALHKNDLTLLKWCVKSGNLELKASGFLEFLNPRPALIKHFIIDTLEAAKELIKHNGYYYADIINNSHALTNKERVKLINYVVELHPFDINILSFVFGRITLTKTETKELLNKFKGRIIDLLYLNVDLPNDIIIETIKKLKPSHKKCYQLHSKFNKLADMACRTDCVEKQINIFSLIVGSNSYIEKKFFNIKHMPPELLDIMMTSPYAQVRAEVVRHPNFSKESYEKYKNDKSKLVQKALCLSPHASDEDLYERSKSFSNHARLLKRADAPKLVKERIEGFRVADDILD